MSKRSLLALLILAIGSVQAWDSKILSAEPLIQLMIAIAILSQAAAVFFGARKTVQIAAVVAAIGLSVVARVASPVTLPDLTLAVVLPALVIWVNLFYEARHGAGRPALGDRG